MIKKPSPRLELVCVGTELLTGKANTHAVSLGRTLLDAGLPIMSEHTVGDDRVSMEAVFRETLQRADIVLSSGGLGPTFDDLTREAWAAVLGRPLRQNKKLLMDIEAKFRRRGIKMPAQNKRQADIFDGAEILQNPFGTAPGQFLTVGDKVVVLLPGPARELFPMFDNQVFPRLKRLYRLPHVVKKSLYIVGDAESRVDQIVAPIFRKFSLAEGLILTPTILASDSLVTVSFSIQGARAKAEQAAKILFKALRNKLGSKFFSEGPLSPPAIIARMFVQTKKTLAIAESCTGGFLAKLLTDIPGASQFFLEGLVSYSNAAKIERLGVSPETLRRYGAVSEETARAMARGLRQKSGADVALSITGVAGPGGGTIDKPVGLVFIGVSSAEKTKVYRYLFPGNRSSIRARASYLALHALKNSLCPATRNISL